MRPSVRALLFAFAALAALGCFSIGRGGASASVPIPVSAVSESARIDHSAPERAGRLTQEQYFAIAASIRSLRADPTELEVEAGDTIRVADLVRIVAYDSAGTLLGELPFYDFTYQGRGFRLLSDGRVRLGRAGTVMFTASMPATHWTGQPRARPSTRVPIVVHRGVR
jgi:hypothetical protein